MRATTLALVILLLSLPPAHAGDQPGRTPLDPGRLFRFVPLWPPLHFWPPPRPGDGNRLTYLDGNDPYYVSRGFPRFVTPQWVGAEGVEAVIVLAIDDMRGHEKWENYLRPILRRLQKIDGRAPVSIMTNQIDPNDPHLQVWLKEGLSLETHTYDHPCPLLKGDDFPKARATYERCVDLLSAVPNSRPVAFRMPCCDSQNTPSPRFYAEIFNRTTSKGNFLAVDSSVFNRTTANDPELPRDLVLDANGLEKFGKYLDIGRTFVNTVEDYPYPYVIGRLCWEFPCATPSDWEAQHHHKSNNPITIRDWKSGVDATVLKQGVFDLVFHPLGWIGNDQVVELIDHVTEKHGKKVKFLTFREAHDRLTKHALGGQPLRTEDGQDNGVRLIDLDNDGYLDVVIGNDKVRQTRLWSPKTGSWTTGDFPVALVTTDKEGRRVDSGARFGILRPDGYPSLLVRNEAVAGVWHFDGSRWIEDKTYLKCLELDGKPIVTAVNGRDEGVRLRDLDKDGRCELIAGNPRQQAVFAWSDEKKTWCRLPFALPAGTSIVDAEGKDAGLRFVDIDEDGHEDLIFSNENNYALYLFTSMEKGWARKVKAGKRGEPGELPMIVRAGTNNGAWFHSRHLWVQNETTALLKDLVDRRSFNDLLAGVEPAAKTPVASLRSLRPRPGFQVELSAYEPLVEDPIAFAWGPDGKLWVVEMGDYPLGADGKGKPGGRIQYLEDTAGDGRYDKATLFLDNLKCPTGVMPWRKGVLVIAAPEIFYAEDTDGDGRVDRREPLFTGFSEGNQQHRVNSLVWGLDNWIYCANGDSGGKVKSVKTGDVVDIRGRDFRIKPDEGIIELQAGQTQFGRGRDDWGNWFGNNNSNPMWHFALDDRYLRRNPHLAAPDVRVPVSVTPGVAPVFPISRTVARFNMPESANHFTSACSAIVYRDTLFGPNFAGNTFVSEPVHNLVHREVMEPQGTNFKSRRALDEKRSEFLASSDSWFRPTTIQTGPDGALWIADMYRQVIEHPEWIPREWQKRLDLRAGHDMGRIYRVFPIGMKPRTIPRLDQLSTAELVAALDSPSGWQRDLAQQMLIWKQDKSAIPLLEKQVSRDAESSERSAEVRSQESLARLHALCTLDGLNALTPAILKRALGDPHPGVRRHAIRLSEAHLDKAPELIPLLVQLTNDADPQVRLQLAYTLGECKDARAGAALGRLAVKDAGDRYILAAAMSSVNRDNLEAVLAAVMTASQKGPPSAGIVENLLRLANAMNQPKALNALLSVLANPEKDRYAPWQYSALAGLLDALDQRGTPLTQVRDNGDETLKSTLKSLERLFDSARALARDPQIPKEERLLAIPLLGRGLNHQTEDIALLSDFLSPQTADEVRSAAIAALGRLRDKQVPVVLVAGWKGFGPAARARVLDALLSREDWIATLLDAIEGKQMLSSEIDAARRQRLLEHKNPAVRKRVATLFADAVNPDRQKVIDAYQPALALEGAPGQGALVFTKHCAACHRLGDVGNNVGPDLASLGDRSPPALLSAILDPNRAVETRYISYAAVTKNGLAYSGVLASETGNSITLAGQDGKQQTILRGDLDELTSTGRSAMPEGLEKEIKPEDMANLIAYVRSVGPQPKHKSFAGNHPEPVLPAADGALLLSAGTCEIYGHTLVFEKQYGNLGYWNSDDDHAIWTAAVPRAGRYEVWLDWACVPGSAGKTFLLQAGPNQLSGKVEATKSWDDYRQAKVGEIILPAGRQRLTFRPASRLYSSSLIDLRSIKLVPWTAE